MFNFNLKKKSVLSAGETYAWIADQVPEHTPDIAWLERKEFHPVFVADECMNYGYRHNLVEEGKSGFFPVYEDCYTSDKFTYLEKHMAKLSQGVLFSTINDDELPMWMNQSFRVKGELYLLTSKHIIELDNYKMNGVWFDRVETNINVPYYPKTRIRKQTYNGMWSSEYVAGKTRIQSVMAYVYVAKLDYWYQQLEKLDNFRPVYVRHEPDKLFIKKFYDYKQQSNS